MTREEAIERIRLRINGMAWCIDDADKEALETCIPELMEDEDEKIREFLYEFIKICAWSDKQYPPREKCLAYLEKQKDHGIQNTAALEKWLKDSVSRFISQLEYGSTIDIDALISDMRKQDFYKECQPIEDIAKDTTKDAETATTFLKNAEIMDENGELVKKYRTEEKKEQNHTLKFKVGDKVYLEGDEDNILTITEIKEDRYRTDSAYGPIFFWDEKRWEKVEQKPIESELKIPDWIHGGWDDEYMINTVIGRYSLHAEVAKKQGNTHEYNLSKSMENWLRNVVRPLILKKQKPAEWSEEDEKMLDSIVNVLEVMPSANFIPIKRETMIPWLKSLLERFNLQPNWKPSEEQMEALKSCFHINPATGESHSPSLDEIYILSSLYNELLKNYKL